MVHRSYHDEHHKNEGCWEVWSDDYIVTTGRSMGIQLYSTGDQSLERTVCQLFALAMYVVGQHVVQRITTVKATLGHLSANSDQGNSMLHQRAFPTHLWEGRLDHSKVVTGGCARLSGEEFISREVGFIEVQRRSRLWLLGYFRQLYYFRNVVRDLEGGGVHVAFPVFHV